MLGMKALGKKIFELRKQKGLSQAELAKRLNISPSAMCRWEKGDRTPAEEDLETLAEFFEVSKEYLLGFEEASEEETIEASDQALSPEPDIKTDQDTNTAGEYGANRRRKTIVAAVLGIVGIAICVAVVLWLNGRNRFVLLESKNVIGNYNEKSFQESSLVPEGCTDEKMDRFVDKHSKKIENDPTYDEYESFSFLFYESEEDYDQGKTCLTHTTFRSDGVLD